MTCKHEYHWATACPYCAAQAAPSAADRFCDANCTWADHAPGCVRAPSAEPVAWRVKHWDGSVSVLHELPTEEEIQRNPEYARNLEPLYYAAPPAPSEWIACSERMPDEGEVVAVLTSCGQRFTAWPTHWRGASSGFAQWTFPSTDMDGVTVTHWMPLPATPKEAK